MIGSRNKLNCSTPNVIYYILCPCNNSEDYVGSTKYMKSRWSKHNQDMRNSNCTACWLTTHFGQYHTGDMEAAIAGLKVVLLDSCEDEQRLKKTEDKWMCDLSVMTGYSKVKRTEWSLNILIYSSKNK